MKGGEEICTTSIDYQAEICVDHACESGNHTLSDGEECDYWGGAGMASRECTGGGFVESTTCSGGGSGGGSGGTSPGGGGTSTGGDEEPDPDGEILVVPLSPAILDEILNCINGPTLIGETDESTIDRFLLERLDNNEILSVQDYLQENGCSEETQNFAIEAISALESDGEVDFIYHIIKDSSFTDTKAECVFDKIQNSSQNFRDRINKFGGDFPVSHFKFAAADLTTSRGRTIPPNSHLQSNSPAYVITIEINNNSTANGMDIRPNLLLAKTIVHEVIHAEMFRKIMSLIKQGSFTGVTAQEIEDALSNGDFPGIYDFYRRAKDWQHAQMAAFYINTISAMLQEFDLGIPVTDKNSIMTFYKDLAWEGLRYQDISAWESHPNQARVNFTIKNYIINHQNESCQ